MQSYQRWATCVVCLVGCLFWVMVCWTDLYDYSESGKNLPLVAAVIAALLIGVFVILKWVFSRP